MVGWDRTPTQGNSPTYGLVHCMVSPDRSRFWDPGAGIWYSSDTVYPRFFDCSLAWTEGTFDHVAGPTIPILGPPVTELNRAVMPVFCQAVALAITC